MYGTCDEDEHEKAEDGVKLREHGEYHGCTEGVVTTTDGRDTIGTNLCLTNGGEEGHGSECKTCTENGTSGKHADVSCHKGIEDEETHKVSKVIFEDTLLSAKLKELCAKQKEADEKAEAEAKAATEKNAKAAAVDF